MTISSTTSKITYAGNDTTTAFSFPYLFNDNSHLKVTEVTTATGAESVKTITTDYTVTGAGNSGGGTVTMVIAPASTVNLVIQREVPYTQETDYTSGDPFPAETHETALDLGTMADQQLDEELGRTLQLTVDEDTIGKIPTQTIRSGQVLSFDSNGDPEAILDAGNLQSTLLGAGGTYVATQVEEQTAGSDGQTAFTLTQVTYTPGAYNITVIWNNGVVRPSQYTETSGTVITPGADWAGQIKKGDALLFIVNVRSVSASTYLASNVIFTPEGTGAEDVDLQTKWRELPSVRNFGVIPDGGVTDYRTQIQNAANATAGKSLYWQPGTYYVSDPGVTLTGNNHHWWSDGEVIIKCERTYYNDAGGGQYTVGQGNVINASGITGITLRNITIQGSYDTGWGDQDVYANNTPDGSGSKLVFFLNCNDVKLDGFRIIKSYASYSPTATEQTSVLGWNQILISGCDDVKLIDCEWEQSVGEAWHIYNCNNVKVSGCNFDCDYGVSFLDITYCTHVRVTDSSFLKNLESDSGDLLNCPSSDVVIAGNTLLNGNIDVGNEYLNRSTTLGETFVCRNIVVEDNTITNGFIQFGTTDDTFTATWAHENIDISNNAITIDLDTRPAANGTTVLNYSGITLPQYKDSRNIAITNNTIILKGALQTGGTPSNLNNIRLINSITDTTGYTRKNFSIEGNTLLAAFSNYDVDNINNLCGAICIQRGIWEDLSIEGNVIDAPCAIMIDRHESMDRVSIKDNSARAESFLNMPFTTDTDLDGFDINDNSFVFYNTSGHSYDSTDIDTRGFGAFINLWGGASTTIEKLQVKNNNVEAVVFALVSNFNTTTAFTVNGVVSDNQVNFVDHLATTGSPNIYPFYFGRVISGTAPSTLHLRDNYFFEDSAVTVDFDCNDIKALDFIANQFIGNFSFTVTTDNVSAVSSSRLIMKNNMSTAALTVTYGNMTTAVLQEISENSTNFSFGGFNKINSVTVASLQSASTAGEGARAFVTDATATTFASTVTGGGSNNVPVYSDGTNWRIG